MSDFWFYFDVGLWHVLDFSGYDHMLFLAMLAVPFSFKDWKTLLLLATLFTLGHTMALVLSVYGILRVNHTSVEFLIPLTIIITALYNIIRNGKKSAKQGSYTFISVLTFIFGIIHGMGFYNFIKIDITPEQENKLVPILGFATGIEAAQVIVVLTVLVLGYVMQRFVNLSQKEWVLVSSAFVAGVALPILINHKIW